MRLGTTPLLGALLVLAACAGDAPTGTSAPEISASEADNAAGPARTYRITLENLTSGQVFWPGVAATHTKDASVWRAGSAASEGIRLIAERSRRDQRRDPAAPQQPGRGRLVGQPPRLELPAGADHGAADPLSRSAS